MTAPPASPRPLAGERVVVTRARHQAASTVEAFAAAGAQVELLPLIEVVPPEDPGPLERALDRLVGEGGFDWVLFTSSNTVDQVFGRLDQRGETFPEGVRTAVIGSATASALRSRDLRPDLEAIDSRAEGLAELLGPCLAGDERLLLPQAADARDVLEDLLREAEVSVTRVAAYAKRMPPDSRDRAEAIFGASPHAPLGWVTFTSPSIARSFAGLWGEEWEGRRDGLSAVSIGPVTSAALRELGVEPAAVAARPGDQEMVDAVSRVVAAGR